MEKSIEKYFRDQAKKHGAMAMKFVSPGNSGVPDRLVVHRDGVVRFVELKKEGGRMRPVQEIMKRKLEGYGLDVTVIDSKAAVDEYWDFHG